jgi:hypothetical protein
MLEWLQGSSLEDLLNSGVELTEPAEAGEDWSLLDEVVAAVAALTEKLKREPELSRDEAWLFCKENAPAQSIFFRSLLWPQARKLAGLPAQAKGGRPPGSRTRKNQVRKTDVLIPESRTRLVAAR